MFWDIHQVDMSDDLRQYRSGGLATKDVTHDQNKATIDSLLCLFTEMDKAVGEGYTKLLPHTKNNEIRNLLLTHVAREVVHQRAYALGAETFGFNDSAWTVFREYKEASDKIGVVENYELDCSKPLDYAKQLSVILLGEGIGLFGAFACFLNMKRHGLLIGFNDVNQWSLADEDFHVRNNIRILKSIINTDLNPDEKAELYSFIERVALDYKNAELNFIDMIYSNAPQQDLTREDLKGYIKYLEAYWLHEIGLIEDISDLSHELEWMDWMLSSKRHDNFFEKRVTSYSHDPLKGKVNYDKYKGILENRLYEKI